MMNKKSTKRALLLSALSLLMCVSMLIGSTFAWFTDEVKSGVNKIEAGNLDIELYHGKVADPEAIDKNKVEGATNLFTDKDGKAIVWEPGVVAWTNLKVANEGSLALKYQLAINFTNENYIKENNAKLSQVLKVAFLDKAITETDREKVLELAKDKGVKLVDLMKSGDLAKGANKIYGVVIYWEPSADDNNWNVYNGRNLSEGEALHIDLGLKLVATQKDAEFDSFGNDYDIGLENSTDGVDRTLNDGSTVRYYSEESGFGGRVRLIALPATVGSEYVVPAEVNDLGGALAGVTLDKLTIHAGVEYASKSLNGSNIDEIVVEDGATEIVDRMFYGVNAGSIVIPATVTEIVHDAFQRVNVKTITIPASVETIGVQAFGSSQVETVIIEGNVTIDNKAFRGCKNLRTVYVNGDDITFANTTGEGNCWFCNFESNNPNTSDITFYVQNAIVAAKVKAAMGAEAGNTPVYINEQVYVPVKNVTEFQAALDNAVNNTIITLTADIAGDVTFTQKNDVTLVLDGNGKKMDGTIKIIARADISNAATLDIKNFNFETTTDRSFVLSSETNRYPNNVTISNCTFKGTGANGNVVAVTVKSANNLVIKNCKADGIHSLLQNTSGWNLTIKDCEVINSGRGMSLGTVQGVTLTNVTVDATKYGVRMDAGYNNDAVITDCNITAFIPVCVRKVSVDSAVTFNGTNTMVEKNTDGIWCAIGTSEYETNGVLPTNAAKTVTVTVNDAGLNTAGICNNSGN